MYNHPVKETDFQNKATLPQEAFVIEERKKAWDLLRSQSTKLSPRSS